MKVFVILAAVICVASSASLSAEQTINIKNGIARYLSGRNQVHDDLIPPIDDPLVLNDTKIDFTALNTTYATGWLSIANGVVDGLSTLFDDLKFNLIALTLTGRATVDRAAIKTGVEADAVINLPISLEERTLVAAAGSSFEGNLEKLGLEGLSLKIHVNLITDRGSISDLQAEVTLGPAHVSGTGIKWDGAEPEWDVVNADLPAFIEDLLTNHHDEVIAIATDLVNIVLQDISISEIIAIIG